MKLISKLAGGGSHPGSGLAVPPEGEVFEADERAQQLVVAGLAADAPAGAAVTWPPDPTEAETPAAEASADDTAGKRRGARQKG